MSNLIDNRDIDIKKLKSNKLSFTVKKWHMLCIALIIITIILRQFFIHNDDASEYYVRNIYPIITWLPRNLNNLLPFSITELLTILFLPFISFFIINLIITIIKSSNRKSLAKNRFIRIFNVILIVVTYLITSFFFNFGFAYNRKNLSENLSLKVENASVDEIYETSFWLVDELNKSSHKVKRYDDGSFILSKSQDYYLKNAYKQYFFASNSNENFFMEKFLYSGPVRVKPVLLSKYWSYTGITGIFIPFWMESNINIATTSDEILFSAMHEIAHSYGFAKEDEANFLAFYVGIKSKNEDFNYSAWLNSFIYLNNALYRTDKNLQQKIYAKLAPEVRIDLNKRSEFWDEYEGPIQDLSDKSNDIYLKSNKQEKGILSYAEVVNLIVAFYKHKIN